MEIGLEEKHIFYCSLQSEGVIKFNNLFGDSGLNKTVHNLKTKFSKGFPCEKSFLF